MIRNRFILFILTVSYAAIVRAQAPANDNCAGAYEIVIPGSGYNFGSFSSPKSNLQAATVQTGEYFSSSFINNGLHYKTLWYKFTTTVTRSITIELKQKDTQINQNAAGLRVYKTGACLPDSTRSSQEFAPIPNFGNTGNSCVPPGTYYLQVCAAQSANDSVWISLAVAQPGPAPYDERTGAYRFGIVNRSLMASTSLGCYSKSSPGEVCTSLGAGYPDYTQTVWFTFETPDVADYLMIDGSAYQNSADAGYKVGFNLFKGDARNNNAQLIPIDTGRVFNRSAFYKVFECGGLQPATTYSVQLFFHKNAASTLQIHLLGASADSACSANPRALPGTYRLGTISNFQTKTTEDFISCNALLGRNMCGSVTPSPAFIAPLPSNPYKNTDTFDYGFWITFHLPQKGVVNTSVWMTDTNNIMNVINGTSIYKDKYYVIKIFKGNVYTTCNLQSISTNVLHSYYEQFCLDSGEHSLQILFSGRNTSATAVKDYLLFGKKFRVDLIYYQSVDQQPAFHDAPYKAENLGNVNAAPGKTVYSTKDYFGGLIDNRLIGGVLTGKNSSYREFYLAERSYVKIVDSTSYYTLGYYTYLFRGSASSDVHALTRVAAQYGSNPFLRPSSLSGIFQSGSCTPLEPGWYTIVSTVSISCFNSSDTLESQITVSVIPAPQANYDKPYKAYMVANGNPVSFTANTGTPEMPSHRKAIVLPAGCFGCETDPVYQLCNSNPVYRNALYYVINIAEECQLFIRPELNNTNKSFLLYKLNVRTDSLQLTDASKIIRSCNNGNEFCRLQPGYYTLVMLDEPGCRSYGYTLVLDKVMYSAYDHAYNSCDMGIIPSDGNVVSSPLDVVSCTTGHSITDPKSTGTFTAYPIPANRLKQKSHSEIDNNWFTFCASGTGTIRVNASAIITSLSTYTPLFTVYSTDAPGYLTMQQLRDRGELDSSIAMGLTKIGANSPSTQEVSFSQNTCDTIRYFIVVDRVYTEYNYHIQAGVQYTGQSNAREGDYCNNAVAFSATNTGTVSGTAAVICHTIGESYGEDGSNMDCLFDQPGYKSTWFKFTLNRSQKTDLSFSLENQTNASSQQVRYRILYGSCDAMTPGPCVETALSTFRLDCMLPGDYYIQVVSPAAAAGIIKVNVNVADAPFPSCKATSPFQPLAKFTFGKEKCNTDTFAFKNLSSAGSQISYFWDFGNGITSTGKAPMIPFTNNNSIDTYFVKLRVHNTFYNLYDSIILPLYTSKDTTRLDAGPVLFAEVNTNVQLNAITNVNGGTFTWFPATGLNDPGKQDPVSTGNQQQLYEVTMIHNLCTYKDSVIVYRYAHDSIIYSQRDFCEGLKDTIRIESKSIAGRYEWSTGDTTTYIRVTEPGQYYLTITAPDLLYFDTINLVERRLLSPLLGNDTSFCKYSGLVLKVNGTFNACQWSTGDTTHSIRTDSAAVYSVTVNDHQCLFSDTIAITRTDVTITGIPDSIMCPGYGNLELTAHRGFDAYLWSTGDTSRKTTIHYPGQYTVKLSQNGCFEFDTIDVKPKPFPFTPLADTVICLYDSLIVHAGNHDGHLWFNSDTSAFTTIYSPGNFTLRIKHEECYLYDTFSVSLHPVKLSLPYDTFYCRHDSVVLDAGAGYDSYRWSTGETTQRIFVPTAGVYFIQAKQDQCYAYDTVLVNMIENKPTLKDTIICPDTEVELHAGIIADRYLWSTGEITQRIFTGNPGTYLLIVFSKGCADSASATVSLFSTERIFESKDTTVCKPFQVVLNAGAGQSIVWLPGGQTYEQINATEYGEYIAIKKDMNGCMVNDTFIISKDCGSSALYVPNAFTLNDDGINDLFKASAFEITDFTIHIYDRWGQEVFHADDPAKGWDGNYNNRPAPADVYVWIINYRDNKGLFKTASGNVTLLR